MRFLTRAVTFCAVLAVSNSWSQETFTFSPGHEINTDGHVNYERVLSSNEYLGELDLVPEQERQLRELLRDFQREYSQRQMLLGGHPESAKAHQVWLADRRQQFQGDVRQILIPYQIDLLNTAALGRVIDKLTGDYLARLQSMRSLELTDVDRKKLESEVASIQGKLDRKIAAIRNRATEELFKHLTPDQYAKLTAILGD